MEKKKINKNNFVFFKKTDSGSLRGAECVRKSLVLTPF